MIAQPLTNVQVELLKIFAYQVDEQTLLVLRDMLSDFFAKQATQQFDVLWEKNNWSDATMDSWLAEENLNNKIQ
jgi:hypothetical protein